MNNKCDNYYYILGMLDLKTVKNKEIVDAVLHLVRKNIFSFNYFYLSLFICVFCCFQLDIFILPYICFFLWLSSFSYFFFSLSLSLSLYFSNLLWHNNNVYLSIYVFRYLSLWYFFISLSIVEKVLVGGRRVRYRSNVISFYVLLCYLYLDSFYLYLMNWFLSWLAGVQ